MRMDSVAEYAARCGAAGNRCRCSRSGPYRTPEQLLCSRPNARPNDASTTQELPKVSRNRMLPAVVYGCKLVPPGQPGPANLLASARAN